MSGTSSLELNEHGAELMNDLAKSFLGQQHTDTKLILKDGIVWTHSLVLAAMSPFVKLLFSEHQFIESIEEPFVLMFPDVTKQEIEFILTLLYCGTANIYKAELSKVVSLTNLLKMVSIPVALTEEAWIQRAEVAFQPSKPRSRAVINFYPSSSKKKRGRPAKPQSSSSDEPLNIVRSIVPSFVEVEANTLQFSTLQHKEKQPDNDSNDTRCEEEDTIYIDSYDNDEMVEEIQVFVSGAGEVERMEIVSADIGKEIEHTPTITLSKQASAVALERVKSKEGVTPHFQKPSTQHIVKSISNDGRVTLIQTEEGEGLDSLISVAEAFEKSQQPDFNDIASPVIDGTETGKRLVKTCVLCGKALLGRNALGRHMKNAHPVVFGPYDCPFEGCGKMIESGSKMIAHMAAHGNNSEEKTESRTCNTCSISFNSPEQHTNHLNKVHNGEKSSSYKPIFLCSAEEPSCREVFNAARHFIKHMKTVHNLNPWKCDECDRRFADKQNYQNHMMTHMEKKDFACDICTKVFYNPRQLYTHRSLHLGRRFLCKHCGFKARSSSNLRGHIKSLHEKKQLKCEMCAKEFSSGSNLKDHIRIHTGETPYNCFICDVNFKRQHHLNGHIESKAHIDQLYKYRKDGIKVPDRLDPQRRRRGRFFVHEGPVTLVSQATFETHIEEVTAQPDHKIDEGSDLPQVVVFENCGDLEPFAIQEQTEEIVSSSHTVHAIS